MKLAAALLLLLGLASSAPDFVSEHPKARVEDWHQREAEINAALADTAKLKSVRLLFVGDSITELWLRGINEWAPGQTYGRKFWEESFNRPGSNTYALNLGVSSDRSEHVLFRILPKTEGGLGELDAPQLDPDVIVLMIGINNAWAPNKLAADSVFAGARKVLIALHERKPRARIVLQSLLPTSFPAMNLAVVQPVNQRLRALATTLPTSGYTNYLDLYPAFVDSAGRQDRRLFNDGVHPSEAGYRVWRDRLVPFLAKVRKKNR
jgi:lysophospholipase L1-like esterase